MSELVIRAPLVRLLVPTKKVNVAIVPPSRSEAAPDPTGVGAERLWHLPEHDEDLDIRASMGRVSGWFMAPG
jgi:hypothetical protein